MQWYCWGTPAPRQGREGEAPAEPQALDEPGEMRTEYSVLRTQYSVASTNQAPLKPAPSVEKVPREGVGSLWPPTTLDQGQTTSAKDGGPREGAEAATRIERRLASGRRLTAREARRLAGRAGRHDTAPRASSGTAAQDVEEQGGVDSG